MGLIIVMKRRTSARFASAVRPSISANMNDNCGVCAFRGTFWVAPSS
jgi:hypothetical protein